MRGGWLSCATTQGGKSAGSVCRRLGDFDVGGNLLDDLYEAERERLVHLKPEQLTNAILSQRSNRTTKSRFIRTVTLPAIPACFLCAVEGVIGQCQALVPIQKFGEGFAKRIAHDSQGQGKRAAHFDSYGRTVFQKRAAQALCHQQVFPRLGDMIEDQELFATPTGEDSGGAYALPQSVGCFQQDHVANRVSEVVIDPFEVIKVGQAQGERSQLTPRRVAKALAL